MKAEDFAYVVETQKSFDDAVVSVLKSVEKKGWSLFQVYDIRERLAAKGFDHKPLKIIEICSGKHADIFLRKNRFVSLCMPCKINVMEEDGKVKIAGMRPTMATKFFPEVGEDEARAAERDMVEIVDGAR